MSSKPHLVIAAVLAATALAACSGNDAGQVPAAGTVAASVNGSPIRESMVQMMLKQRSNLGREANAEMRKSFIERLAMQQLIADEAVKKGLDKTPEVMDQIELSRQSVLIDAFIQNYLKSNAISDDQLKAEYEKLKAEAANNKEYKARHILVQEEAEAKDIIEKLKKNPKSFDALAKQKSKDPGSKVRGGDLGWFDPRQMVPEFGAAVAKLDKGAFTLEPVKSQFGYHVIQLEDSRTAAMQALDEIKDSLKQHLQEQSLKKYFDDLKANAKIEIKAAPASAPQEAKPADAGKK